MALFIMACLLCLGAVEILDPAVPVLANQTPGVELAPAYCHLECYQQRTSQHPLCVCPLEPAAVVVIPQTIAPPQVFYVQHDVERDRPARLVVHV